MSLSVLASKVTLTNATKLQESITLWQKRSSGIIALIGAGNWNGITNLKRKGKASGDEKSHFWRTSSYTGSH